MAPAITLDRIGKCYSVPSPEERAAYHTLRESIMALPRRLWRGRSRPQEFWALRDVSFTVEAGEAVGIVGRNGAGKSTLLKILSRITSPTEGQVTMRGRVGSLLEVGTGFHPELTGRENIFLNGSILGMSRRQVSARFDEIVAFAEIEAFLDTPVKRYSSGMYTRLAFAVAAHLEPEILVIDEVLAVGDVEFQKKCIRKMGDVASQGRTVLFVSHNMAAVQAVCQRAVLLSRGQVQAIGSARDVVAQYLTVSDKLCDIPLSERTDRRGGGRFRFEHLTLYGSDGCEHPFAVTGEDLQLHVRLKTPPGDGRMASPLDVAIIIRDRQGYKLTELATHFVGASPQRPGDARELVCHLPRLPLLAGMYRIDLWCGTGSDAEDMVTDAAILRVEPGNYFRTRDARLPVAEIHGCLMIPQSWTVSSPCAEPSGSLHEPATEMSGS